MIFGIHTLGCRVNQYESRVIAEKLSQIGHTECEFTKKCDIYIINTCAVTAESVRKSRQIIRRAKTINPDALIIITGCFSQISPDDVRVLSPDAVIIGNGQKIQNTITAIENYDKGTIYCNDTDMDEYEDCTLQKPVRYREYIKIEDGCDGKCSYCVIPRARGRVRSKKIETVISELKQLVKCGAKEIIFTGIETASYQYDLLKLFKEAECIDGLKRFSCGSLEPTLFKESFVLELAKLQKFTPHIHISVQSGCSSVLNRMRRKYNIDMLNYAIELLRKNIPHIQFTCDIIVGFPGETEDEFNQTKEFIKKAEFLHAHIFPYSKRPLTAAAEMNDQIPENIKNQRLSQLLKLQAEIKHKILENEISTRTSVPVLFETNSKGHSDNYIEYIVNNDTEISGKILYVQPTHTDGNVIYAKIL